MFGYLLLYVAVHVGYVISAEEPVCLSKFDYEFKVRVQEGNQATPIDAETDGDRLSDEQILQKLSDLETKQREQQTKFEEQIEKINTLEHKLKEHSQSLWAMWSTWGDCYFDCTGNNSGRIQTRSRTTNGSPAETETESRPCNAVQFSGCVKDYGINDNYAVTYDSADQVAVAICTAIYDAGGYIYAVRRECSNLTVSCEDTCKSIGMTCFNALHFHRYSIVQKRNDVAKQGLYMYRYNSCSGSYCGPNFCCCKK